jgi:hypothetical protein
MRFRMRFSLLTLFLFVPAYASANIYSFQLTKTNEKWQCKATIETSPNPIQIAVAVQGNTGGDAAVKLNAKVDLETGTPLTGSLMKLTLPGVTDVWQLRHSSMESTAKLVTIDGSVDGINIEACTSSVAAGGEQPTPPVSRAKITALDFAAAEWLATHSWKFDLLRAEIAREQPKYRLDRIVFLPHLPSGAKAPSYPTSISEQDIGQVVMVVPDEEGAGGFAGAVDWSLTRCESIPLYRVYGSIEGLATAQSTAAAKRRKPRFTLRRIGHTMSCGADALGYTLIVTSESGVAGDPMQFTVPVRPVYHLGATGIFGYDFTNQSTFVVRNGKIDEVKDRVGTGLLVGGTYFVNGVDFGNMRWYNYFANPFVVVSLESPKDRFVVGAALTQRGGISLALGVAFNHVSKLASGFAEDKDFTGEGDIPLDKEWRHGFYVGVAVDDKLFASFKKLKAGGTGGGTATPSAEEGAKKNQAEEDKKQAEENKKKDGANQ